MSEAEPNGPTPTDATVPPDNGAVAAVAEGRCEAVTTAGGTEYRCALEAEHDGEHAFQPVDAGDVEAPPTVDDEADKYRKRITGYLVKNMTERYGAEPVAALMPCPMCSYSDTFGFVVPQQMPFQVVESVKQILGWRSLMDYEADDDSYTRCPACQGKGQTRTHSEVPGEELKRCKKCEGHGYLELNQQGPPTVAVPVPGAAPAENGSPAADAQYDEWGTPHWHPDFGKTLQYRTTPVEHWAVNLPAAAPA